MALSRLDNGDAFTGGANSFLTSSRDRALGRVRPLLGRSITVKGFRLTRPWSVKKEKNPFRAETRLALLRFEMNFFLQCSRKS